MGKEFIGAKWWKVDFHAHSPGSYDFSSEEGIEKSEDKPSYDEWLNTYIESDIDLVVVTDHDSVNGYFEIKSIYDQLEAELQNRISVLPGIEVTSNQNIHVLGIFSENTAESVLHKIKEDLFPSTNKEGSTVSPKSAEQVIEYISNAGGIAIPAHVDGPSGLFRNSVSDTRTIDRIVSEISNGQSNHALAMELTDARYLDPSNNFLSDIEENNTAERLIREKIHRFVQQRTWIPVLGSDSHFLNGDSAPVGLAEHQIKFPGSHFTWVKMETPTFEALSVAFLEGENAFIPSISTSNNPNEVDFSYISKIEVSHKSKNQIYKFSPWNNSLIGGRGTGKSTIIELIRLVNNRFDELPDAVYREISWFSPNKNEMEKSFWDETTEIKFEFIDAGTPFVVKWCGSNPHEFNLYKNNSDKEENRLSGKPSEHFPISIFSQKQIYETARDPQIFMEIIDQQPEVSQLRLEQRIFESKSKIGDLYSELIKVINNSQIIESKRARLQVVNNQIDKYSSIVDSPEFIKVSRLNTFKSQFNSGFSRVANLGKPDELKSIKQEMFKLKLSFDEKLMDSSIANSISCSIDEIICSLADINGGYEKISSLLVNLPLEDLKSEINEIIAENYSAISQDDIHDESFSVSASVKQQVLSLKQEAAELESELKIASDGESLQKIQTEITDEINNLRDLRKNLRDSRTRVAQRINSTNSNLEIKIHALGSLDSFQKFEAKVREAFSIKDSYKDVFEHFASTINKSKFNYRDPGQVNRYYRAIDEIISALQEDGKNTIRSLPYGGKFIDRFNNKEITEIAQKLALDIPKDSIEIRYRPEGERSFKDITEGSPGQKTAALLAALLVIDKTPLVLDQPEDDLDNKLITNLIVENLQKAKMSRQVIIATHNANIVVNGDSENVISVGAGVIPEIENQGSAHATDTRESICSILEGGRAAFDRRYNKLSI